MQFQKQGKNRLFPIDDSGFSKSTLLLKNPPPPAKFKNYQRLYIFCLYTVLIKKKNFFCHKGIRIKNQQWKEEISNWGEGGSKSSIETVNNIQMCFLLNS